MDVQDRIIWCAPSFDTNLFNVFVQAALAPVFTDDVPSHADYAFLGIVNNGRVNVTRIMQLTRLYTVIVDDAGSFRKFTMNAEVHAQTGHVMAVYHFSGYAVHSPVESHRQSRVTGKLVQRTVTRRGRGRRRCRWSDDTCYCECSASTVQVVDYADEADDVMTITVQRGAEVLFT